MSQLCPTLTNPSWFVKEEVFQNYSLFFLGGGVGGGGGKAYSADSRLLKSHNKNLF